jgi:hypothetical protein
MKELWGRVHFRLWLAIMGTATLILGAAYAMVQQSTRLAADDLPLATAQTVKQEINNGANPVDVIPAIKTDLANDSIPFVIVTDNSQHVLASSAQLNGKTPLPPSGVFDYTKSHGTDHFTWQPANNARLATRVLSYKDGFIITGQSLNQAENRINDYTALAVASWVAVLGWTTLTLIIPTQKK